MNDPTLWGLVFAWLAAIAWFWPKPKPPAPEVVITGESATPSSCQLCDEVRDFKTALEHLSKHLPDEKLKAVKLEFVESLIDPDRVFRCVICGVSK